MSYQGDHHHHHHHGKWKRKRQDSFSPRLHDFPPHVRQALQPCFEKKFTYDGAWPEDEVQDINSGAAKWEDAELQKLKASLNSIKSQLNDYDIQTWHEHTGAMNPAGLIINTVKRSAYPELCTQAWCKFHEILSSYDVIKPGQNGEFNSLHLCEAPGAFVTSLNHYLQSRTTGVLQWQWTANTLNPHYEGNTQRIMIADDRFIQNTMSHWHYGSDNMGNIMSASNIRDVISYCGGSSHGSVNGDGSIHLRDGKGSIHLGDKDRKIKSSDREGSIHLVTADGSICCANNPAEQEGQTAKLHYCEVVTALGVLAKGGSFVLKMFTLFEESSISLMYLLNCFFEEVHVFKPCSSKPGNSEVYVLSLGFTTISSAVLERIFKEVNDTPFETCILNENAIPEAFRIQHRKCCRTFFDFQTATIEQNREAYHKPMSDQEKRNLLIKRQCCADMYITKCRLSQLAYHQRIVPKSDMRHNTNPQHSNVGYLESGRVEGSYAQRTNCSRLEKLRNLPKFDFENGKIRNHSKCAEDEKDQDQNTTKSSHFENAKSESNVIGCLEIDHARFRDKFASSSTWDLVTGKEIGIVHSSRFCDQHLLSLYIDCLEELENLDSKVDKDTPGANGESVQEKRTRKKSKGETNKHSEHTVENEAIHSKKTENEQVDSITIEKETIHEIARLLTDASLQGVQNIDSLTHSKTNGSSNNPLIQLNVLCTDPEKGYIAKRLKDCIIESEEKTNPTDTPKDNSKNTVGLPKVLCIELDPKMVYSQSTNAFLQNSKWLHLEWRFLANKNTQLQVLNELQRLANGDHVIVTLPIQLTRFSNSVVFVLAHVFHSLKFLPSHFQDGDLRFPPMVTVVCLSFIEEHFEKFSNLISKVCAFYDCKNQRNSTENVKNVSSNLICPVSTNEKPSSGKPGSDVTTVNDVNGQIDLLQFVPMKLLYSSHFYSVVSKVNDHLLKLRINQLLSLLA